MTLSLIRTDAANPERKRTDTTSEHNRQYAAWQISAPAQLATGTVHKIFCAGGNIMLWLMSSPSPKSATVRSVCTAFDCCIGFFILLFAAVKVFSKKKATREIYNRDTF